jgi:hypothetical protein
MFFGCSRIWPISEKQGSYKLEIYKTRLVGCIARKTIRFGFKIHGHGSENLVIVCYVYPYRVYIAHTNHQTAGKQREREKEREKEY